MRSMPLLGERGQHLRVLHVEIDKMMRRAPNRTLWASGSAHHDVHPLPLRAVLQIQSDNHAWHGAQCHGGGV